jgi:uncharacterized protein YbaR (Trm112 family)
MLCCPLCNNPLSIHNKSAYKTTFFKCYCCKIIVCENNLSETIISYIIAASKQLEPMPKLSIYTHSYLSYLDVLYDCFLDVYGFIPQYCFTKNTYYNLGFWEIIQSHDSGILLDLLCETSQTITPDNIDKKLKFILAFL